MFSGAKIHKHLHHIRVPDWSTFLYDLFEPFRNWFPCEIFPNTTLLELALDYIKKGSMPTLQARAYALHLTNPILYLGLHISRNWWGITDVIFWSCKKGSGIPHQPMHAYCE